TPKVSHLHAVKRIFIYLKGQPKVGLWYPSDSPFDLEYFSDSDYAGASPDGKSIIGGYQFLGSYEHYKGVGAEVELLEPGFELQGSKMVEIDFFNDPRIIREQRIASYKGYRGGGVVQIGMKSLWSYL
nr:putative ribonuclease H-like domain-containing protein [Tanacetum cinerariifolium]